MTENKRYEVAVYDDKAINGYCVLDKNQPSVTARLDYKNVFISSEYGCRIVANLLNDKEYTINEMAKTIRIYDDGYIDLNKKYKKVVDENEQLKTTINDIRLDWNQDYRDLYKDTLCIEDHNTKIELKDGKLYIEVFIPKINEYFRFSYFVTGRTLSKEFVLGDSDD